MKNKFGTLVDKPKPTLIVFYSPLFINNTEASSIALDTAATFGNEVDVIKIDVNQNQEITEALRVKQLPAYILYNHGDMVWRQAGEVPLKVVTAVIKNEFKKLAIAN